MILAADARKAGRFINPDEGKIVRSFRSAKIDSREVKKGDLFFAVKGEHTDGHNYLADAFKRGAAAVVAESRWLKNNRSATKAGIILEVDDTVAALGEIARLHRIRHGNIPILLIGGANGKTTTKDLVSAVLSEKFRVLKTQGNLNNHLGLPMMLLNLNKRHQVCVLEAGCNHYGEVDYLCRVAMPDAGLVTNIGREHLEFFGDLHGVAKAEFELYDYLKKREKATCFLNLDDKFIRNYSKNLKHEFKFSYSYDFDADVKGRSEGYGKHFQPRIGISFGGRAYTAEVSTFGKHSLFNGLAAAAVGHFYGVSPQKIRRALKNFKQSSAKRMEVIRKNGLIIINDTYNSNPDSVRIGLETLMEYEGKGERHAVLGDMLELGRASKPEHEAVGRQAGKMNLKNLYLFGKESRATFSAAGRVPNNFYFDTKEDLAALLKKRLRKGDVVYVKGSRGMKMEDIVNLLTA